MYRSPRNGFDDTLSAKRSAAAAAYAASLAEIDTEDTSPEYLAQRRQVSLLASQAALRAGLIAEAAELAPVAANTAALAAAAAGVDVFNSVVAIQGAVSHCKVDSLGLIVHDINEKLAEEKDSVARLIDFANASSKMATLAAEAAAEAAEAAALIAETAMTVICNANRHLSGDAILSERHAAQQGVPDGSGRCLHKTDITEVDINTKSFPKGQWISFMNPFID